MTQFLTTVADSFGPTLLAVALLFAVAESALGVGSLVPGEAVILALGVAVTTTEQAMLLLATVALGACVGDHAGYVLGRSRSATIRASRPVTRIGVGHWDRATELVQRHGGLAVGASRLLPVVRTLTPAVAGAARLPYRRFAIASATGSLLWATLWVGTATVGGVWFAHILGQVGPVATVALAVAAGAVVTALQRRRSRARRPISPPTLARKDRA